MPSVVENAIGTGKTGPGRTPITTRYYDGVNDVTVIINNQTGNVVTVY